MRKPQQKHKHTTIYLNTDFFFPPSILDFLVKI